MIYTILTNVGIALGYIGGWVILMASIYGVFKMGTMGFFEGKHESERKHHGQEN